MAPTLNKDVHETGRCEWVVISSGVKYSVEEGAVKRGDVVTFWKPGRGEELAVKRVVGVGGDAVWVRRGYAVEGEEEGRLGLMDGLGVEDGRGKVVVPHGHIWVEGDNWRNSYDSCDFGPISLGLVVGKAVRVWRGWGKGFVEIGDARGERDKRAASRVVEGRSMVPDIFVE